MHEDPAAEEGFWSVNPHGSEELKCLHLDPHLPPVSVHLCAGLRACSCVVVKPYNVAVSQWLNL